MLFLEKGVKGSARRIDLGRSGGGFFFQVTAQREELTFVFIGLAFDARGDRLSAFEAPPWIEKIALAARMQLRGAFRTLTPHVHGRL
jgi:hypothetical protein